MSLSLAAHFTIFVGLICSSIVCGAWWYAALLKRKVAIFYWLAAAHTLSFGIHAISVVSHLVYENSARMLELNSMRSLMVVIMAGLYVALARWLVRQPDSPSV